jgi:hypothetical protein
MPDASNPLTTPGSATHDNNLLLISTSFKIHPDLELSPRRLAPSLTTIGEQLRRR